MAGIGHRGFMGRKKEPFTPLDDPNLLAWYPFDITANITESGGAVSGVLDNSGNGRHLNSNKQPTTGATTQNGMNVIAFNNNNLRFVSAVTRHNTTVLQVLNRTSNSPTSQITINQAGTTSNMRLNVIPNYIIRNSTQASGGVGLPLNSWRVLSATFTVSSQSKLRENGVEIIPLSDTGLNVQSDWEFGTSGNNGAVNPAQYFVGNIAEIIVTESIDDEIIEKYETYLALKWGII